MDNTALVPTRGVREVSPNIWQMIWDMAPVMYASRLFGVSSKEQAAAIMLKGYELGLSITASFEFVQVVQGRPSLSPRGALALLHNAPEIAEISIRRLADGDAFVGYQCTIERRNGFSHTSQFTMLDAINAGVVKANSGWANYPENMCLWRAIGFCADVVAPDITAGMTTLMKAPEQYGVALSDAGEIIDVTPVTRPVTATVYDLDALVTQYGAEAVLVASNGSIPATDAEVAAVAAVLQGTPS